MEVTLYHSCLNVSMILNVFWGFFLLQRFFFTSNDDNSSRWAYGLGSAIVIVLSLASVCPPLGNYLFKCFLYTGPRSAVGNVSGNRCESDCRSRGREFDPGPVPYFRGDWSWNNFYGHSPPFRWIIQEGLLSVTSESMCTKYWLTACSSLPRKKCGWVNWPSRNDHSCWLGT